MVLSLLTGCRRKEPAVDPNAFIFNPVDTSFVSTQLIVPGGKFKLAMLYMEGDSERVEWKNMLAPAKGKHDFMAFLPINGSPTHGILWVNHETTVPHDQIGDGGGASVMEVYRDTLGGWKLIGFPYAIDFSSVGGTLANCLGTTTPWGTILTSEEIEPASARTLHGRDSLAQLMVRDTANIGGRPRWMNYGWMVEVDPIKREVLGKRHAMGRFMHEGAFAMPDERTFYLLDDEAPGAFFKFVADTARNLNSGQLYAYRHVADTLGSHWLRLPRGRDSLLYARRHAFQGGATMFIRLEDIDQLEDGSFILTETGKDSADFSTGLALGGKVAPHLERLHVGNRRYNDRHGRLLRFDPKTDEFTVLLEGGQALEDKSIVLSNPDNIAIDRKRGLLVIQEDLNGSSDGRIPAGTGIASKAKPGERQVVNEIYFIPLSNAKLRLDDLRRFAVLPVGFESTGAVFTPDGGSLFINLQVGDDPGVPPFDRSMTVVVSGFGE